MATQSFKIGDSVQLKSGGPEMTVKSVPEGPVKSYRCQWFAGKKLDEGVFPPDSLKAHIAPPVSTPTPVSK
ncbi:YodC family protein [Paraburkholderia nemoris]|uniref:YodC family protein n=1 Tax=Paraburkholderia nemoris TaxID=2793076 RepID=UPI0038BBBB11